jgi:hypothetical protein
MFPTAKRGKCMRPANPRVEGFGQIHHIFWKSHNCPWWGKVPLNGIGGWHQHSHLCNIRKQSRWTTASTKKQNIETSLRRLKVMYGQCDTCFLCTNPATKYLLNLLPPLLQVILMPHSCGILAQNFGLCLSIIPKQDKSQLLQQRNLFTVQHQSWFFRPL